MKTLVLSMISIAATVAAMTACTSESDPVDEITTTQQDVKTPIEFKSSIIGIQTKAISSNSNKFEANTDIAISMYKGENAPTGEALGTPNNSSVEFTVGSDQQSLAEKAANKTMFWERNTKHYFYAYYPIVASDANYTYTAATTNTAEQIKITVPADGSTTDLLMGSLTSGLTFEGTAVNNANIQFSHKLSKIKFVFKKDASFQGSGTLSNIALTLNKSIATFDLVGQTPVLSGEPIELNKSDINLPIQEETPYNAWQPIVLPTSTINSLTLTIDGKPIEAKSLTATLTAGSITTITITLKGSGITDLTTGIDDWSESNTGAGEII